MVSAPAAAAAAAMTADKTTEQAMQYDAAGPRRLSLCTPLADCKHFATTVTDPATKRIGWMAGCSLLSLSNEVN